MSGEPQDHRVFFAARLGRPAADRVHRFTRALADTHRLGGHAIPPDRLHVSLAMVGRYRSIVPRTVVDHAGKVAGRVALRPFKATLNRLQSWRPSHGPLVLVGDEGTIGLERLHDALAEAQGRKPDLGFTPHVSLIWSPDFLAERVVEPFSWMVDEFVLIHSIHGQGRHEVLGRWSLRG
jgi:2'-5' RNA ligase